MATKWRSFTGTARTTRAKLTKKLKGFTVGGNAGWAVAFGTSAIKNLAVGEPVYAAVDGAICTYNVLRTVTKSSALLKLPPAPPSSKFVSAATNGALAVGFGLGAYFLDNSALLWGLSAYNAVNGSCKAINRFPYTKKK
jgi:hypothetical protein